MHLTYLVSADYIRTTGGWIYNERMLRELAAIGWQITRIELGPGFPDPAPDVTAGAARVIAGLPGGTLVLADQIVLSPLADVLPAAAARLRFAMLMHHPQVLESSRPPAVAARMDRQERAALGKMECVIATSRLTGAQLIADYGVDSGRLFIAEPGTDLLQASPGSGGPGVHLFSLGSVIARKRHELIVGALAGLMDLDWRLTIAGALDMNDAQVAKLRQLIGAVGLADRIALSGALSGPDLEAIWQTTDLYVASSVHEGFGMAVAEAIARRIPVVTTRSGAVGGWIDPRASVLVEPDDTATMRAVLRRVLSQPELLKALREGTVLARSALVTWPQSARIVGNALSAPPGDIALRLPARLC